MIFSTENVKTATKGTENKIGAQKPTRQLKPGRRVEILDPKLIENLELPHVQIEDESCKIDVDRRIHDACGIPSSSAPARLPLATTIPTLPSNSNLEEPKFQSSLSLMTNLERLKSTEIDPRRLLKLKLEKDKKMQISIKKKVANVINVNSSETVFSHLQSLSLNTEEIISRQESKRLQLAEKFAPKKGLRDPELQLADFCQPPVTEDKSVFPAVSMNFIDECCQFGIQPFALHSVPMSNHLEAYNLCMK